MSRLAVGIQLEETYYVLYIGVSYSLERFNTVFLYHIETGFFRENLLDLENLFLIIFQQITLFISLLISIALIFAPKIAHAITVMHIHDAPGCYHSIHFYLR